MSSNQINSNSNNYYQTLLERAKSQTGPIYSREGKALFKELQQGGNVFEIANRRLGQTEKTGIDSLDVISRLNKLGQDANLLPAGTGVKNYDDAKKLVRQLFENNKSDLFVQNKLMRELKNDAGINFGNERLYQVNNKVPGNLTSTMNVVLQNKSQEELQNIKWNNQLVTGGTENPFERPNLEQDSSTVGVRLAAQETARFEQANPEIAALKDQLETLNSQLRTAMKASDKTKVSELESQIAPLEKKIDDATIAAEAKEAQMRGTTSALPPIQNRGLVNSKSFTYNQQQTIDHLEFSGAKTEGEGVSKAQVDGKLTLDELKRALMDTENTSRDHKVLSSANRRTLTGSSSAVTDSQVEALFKRLDKDNSGAVELKELFANPLDGIQAKGAEGNANRPNFERSDYHKNNRHHRHGGHKTVDELNAMKDNFND
jgi:hypothetical protein